jgi:integrase
MKSASHTAISPRRKLNLEELAIKADAYAANALAPNTRRAYEACVRSYEQFCKAKHLDPAARLSPQTLVLYLTHLTELGRKMSTIYVHLSALKDHYAKQHRPLRDDDRYVKAFLAGLEREIGGPPHKKEALTFEMFLSLERLPHATLREKRDRALILLGFAMAARRSEIAALNVSDLTFERKGLVVMTRRSKTDKRGRGLERGVPRLENKNLCPVRALRIWMRAANITRGPVFRTFSKDGDLQRNRIDPKDVARAVKRVVGRSIKGDFSAHSLRSGYITSAARAGIALPSIMAHTGHKTSNVVVGYIKRSRLLQDSGLTQIAAADQEPPQRPRRGARKTTDLRA